MPLNWPTDETAGPDYGFFKRDESKIDNPESAKVNGQTGILYMVATPLGNMDDITLRALKILGSVDLIAAENVTRTRGLCRRHGMRVRITKYNEHNRARKAGELTGRLKSGWNIALVTDAGTPGISDPGAYLTSKVVEEGIQVVPVPGPSAVISALSISGMSADAFVFAGFLPNKKGKRRQELTHLVSERRTLVFFEAPHRMVAMLTDLYDILGDRPMVMVREMTKVFEEVIRDRVANVLRILKSREIRGEFTLVVSGNEETESPRELSKQALKRMDTLLEERHGSVRDIAERIAIEEGISYRRVYKECISRKNAFKTP